MKTILSRIALALLITSLAGLSVFAKGKTEVQGAEELRVKESDRVEAAKHGAHVEGVRRQARANCERLRNLIRT